MIGAPWTAGRSTESERTPSPMSRASTAAPRGTARPPPPCTSPARESRIVSGALAGLSFRLSDPSSRLKRRLLAETDERKQQPVTYSAFARLGVQARPRVRPGCGKRAVGGLVGRSCGTHPPRNARSRTARASEADRRCARSIPARSASIAESCSSTRASTIRRCSSSGGTRIRTALDLVLRDVPHRIARAGGGTDDTLSSRSRDYRAVCSHPLSTSGFTLEAHALVAEQQARTRRAYEKIRADVISRVRAREKQVSRADFPSRVNRFDRQRRLVLMVVEKPHVIAFDLYHAPFPVILPADRGT